MEYNPFSLKGKTILVTGASSGIGRASAIECSKMGAKLILIGRNEDRLLETFKQLEGFHHQFYLLDINKEEERISLFSQIDPIDGLVLCAGIADAVPLKFASPEKVKKVFETNFFSTVEFVRLLHKNKRISKGSSIIAIASIGGVYSIDIGNGIYGASKAALVSWMKFLAKELAPFKIRVNCICPGMVKTPFIYSGTVSNDQLKEDEKRYPLGRYGNPEDIAFSVVYFLSDASEWITGTNFVIDGGISI